MRHTTPVYTSQQNRWPALACLIAVLSVPFPTFAGGKTQTQTYTDYATVTRVVPQYRTIRVETPVTECWTEHQQINRSQHRRYNRHSSSGRRSHSQASGNAIIGGIVGGAIGHTIGKQSNHSGAKAGATIAGAIIGSTIANEAATPRRSRHTVTETVPVERCETRSRLESQEKLIGYRVSYQYRGQRSTVMTRQHPGKRLPIDVTIRPRGVL